MAQFRRSSADDQPTLVAHVEFGRDKIPAGVSTKHDWDDIAMLIESNEALRTGSIRKLKGLTIHEGHIQAWWG